MCVHWGNFDGDMDSLGDGVYAGRMVVAGSYFFGRPRVVWWEHVVRRLAGKQTLIATASKPTTVAFGTPDRVEWHLHNWKAWMHTGRSVDRLPRRSTGIGNSHSTSFDDMIEASDVRCAMITDALISDLAPSQSSAIHRKYLSAVYRFPRDNYLQELEYAKREIGAGLKNRGVW